MAIARFILFSSIPASRSHRSDFNRKIAPSELFPKSSAKSVARLEPKCQKLCAFYLENVNNKCVIKKCAHKEIHLDASYTLYFITQILTSYKNTLRNSCGEDGMVSFTWWRTLHNNIHFKYPEVGVLPYTCMCRGIGYGFGGYRFASVSIVFPLWSLDRICKLYRLKLQCVNGQLNKRQIPLKLSTKRFYRDLCFAARG